MTCEIGSRKRSPLIILPVTEETTVTASPISRDGRLSTRIVFSVEINGIRRSFWLDAKLFVRLYDEAEENEQEVSGPVKAAVRLSEDGDEVLGMNIVFRPVNSTDDKQLTYQLDAVTCDQIRAVLRKLRDYTELLRITLNSVAEAGEMARRNGSDR